jgi:Flp pilus assembly protein CpaB
VVLTTMQGADARRAAWGRSTTVLVAVHDLQPGDPLDASTTRPEARPEPLVADGALRELPDRARVAEAVYAGEVIRAERLAPGETSRVAARLPPGTLAVAIPLDPGRAPPLEAGDRVDVLVAVSPEAAGSGPPGFALAEAALVVDVDDAAATVAVPRDLAPRLAAAFGQGAVTLALVAGG